MHIGVPDVKPFELLHAFLEDFRKNDAVLDELFSDCIQSGTGIGSIDHIGKIGRDSSHRYHLLLTYILA